MTAITRTSRSATARKDTPMTAVSRPVPAQRQPWWLYAGVIIGALGVASLAYGALIDPKTILSAGQEVTSATRAYGRYAAAYDLALAAALVVPLVTRSWRILTGTLLQAVFAEFLLAIVGIVDHRWEQIPADIALIAIFAVCARRLRTSIA